MSAASRAVCGAVLLLVVPGAFGALCSNWGNSTCDGNNDGGCSCHWDGETCIKTTNCSGVGITGIGAGDDETTTTDASTSTTQVDDAGDNGTTTTDAATSTTQVNDADDNETGAATSTTQQHAAQVSDAGRSPPPAWCAVLPLLASLPLLSSGWGAGSPFA